MCSCGQLPSGVKRFSTCTCHGLDDFATGSRTLSQCWTLQGRQEAGLISGAWRWGRVCLDIRHVLNTDCTKSYHSASVICGYSVNQFNYSRIHMARRLAVAEKTAGRSPCGRQVALGQGTVKILCPFGTEGRFSTCRIWFQRGRGLTLVGSDGSPQADPSHVGD